MAKLSHDNITAEDLKEFAQTGGDDFSFEVQVLNRLCHLQFQCEHGGLYPDPLQGKSREFDIRAARNLGQWWLRLAVECKNVRPYCPLLVHCLPRRKEESFHDVIVAKSAGERIRIPAPGVTPPSVPPPPVPHATVHSVAGLHSLYSESQPVGKSCSQVGRKQPTPEQRKANEKGEFADSDSEVYDKWSQSLASAHQLTKLFRPETGDTIQRAYTLVVPMVVVPDGRLWQVRYDLTGQRLGDPEPTTRCSYFVGQTFRHAFSEWDYALTISHLEFVTVSGLTEFIGRVLRGSGFGSAVQAVIEGRIKGGSVKPT